VAKEGGGAGNNWAAGYCEGEKYYEDIIERSIPEKAHPNVQCLPK